MIREITDLRRFYILHHAILRLERATWPPQVAMLRLRIKQLIDNSLFGVIPSNIITTVALGTFFAGNMLYSPQGSCRARAHGIPLLIVSNPSRSPGQRLSVGNEWTRDDYNLIGMLSL